MHFVYYSKRPWNKNSDSTINSFTKHVLIGGNRQDVHQNVHEMMVLQTKVAFKGNFNAHYCWLQKNRNVDFSKWEMGLDFDEYSIFSNGWKCKSVLHILENSKISVWQPEISIRPVEYSTKSEHRIFRNTVFLGPQKFQRMVKKVQVLPFSCTLQW